VHMLVTCSGLLCHPVPHIGRACIAASRIGRGFELKLPSTFYCSCGMQYDAGCSWMLPIARCCTVYMRLMLLDKQALLALAIHGLQCTLGVSRSGNKIEQYLLLLLVGALAALAQPCLCTQLAHWACMYQCILLYPALSVQTSQLYCCSIGAAVIDGAIDAAPIWMGARCVLIKGQLCVFACRRALHLLGHCVWTYTQRRLG